jgi:AcrR family transcriptional regulator
MESRDRLVQSAAALFAERGYEATSMNDIGQLADVSRATVFNYFPRKEDLVIAWFDNRRADFADALAETADSPEGTSDRLRRAFRALARVFEDDPKTGRGMVRAWLLAGGPLLTPESDTTRLFAAEIRRGQQRGDVSSEIDPNRAGQLLFDAYLGVLFRWVTPKQRVPHLEDTLLATLDLLLSGIEGPRGRSTRKQR